MTDMLVKLYALPEARESAHALPDGVTVRRAMAYEKRQVIDWVSVQFGNAWASECDVSFSNQPLSCLIATRAGQLLGFACYDSVCRGFFGPIGVHVTVRRTGIGGALLRRALEAMAQAGYGYAIIGGVRDQQLYERVAGATPIAGSSPGIYVDRLTPADSAGNAGK